MSSPTSLMSILNSSGDSAESSAVHIVGAEARILSPLSPPTGIASREKRQATSMPPILWANPKGYHGQWYWKPQSPSRARWMHSCHLALIRDHPKVWSVPFLSHTQVWILTERDPVYFFLIIFFVMWCIKHRRDTIICALFTHRISCL